MQVKEILVPLDGSAVSEAALPYAEQLARAMHVPVRLVTVVQTAVEGLLMPRNAFEELIARRREDAEAYLPKTVADLQGRGVDVSGSVVVGDPVERILSAAGDGTIIVMATHGRGGVERFLVGSVADKVMRMSGQPTLLVRSPVEGAAAKPPELRRLMVPLDGSPLAEAAVAPAGELASALGASVTLVRVQQWMATYLAPADGYIPEMDEWEQEAAADAKDYLETVRRRLPVSVPSGTVVLRGPATLLLEKYVNEHAPDLVVMTTHARGGLPRFVLGSTADRLIRDGVPTLLIHPVLEPSANTDLRAKEAMPIGGLRWPHE